jgi:hypothetical protein
MVIGPEGTGGLLTQTEFEIAIFCTEEKLKKRASEEKWKKRPFIL